ncbi:MAG: methyltransferase domain-containing protein [Phenylobacterium sp.]|uniref:class I SAM-dependent methyltransferase n=1 Tax=Phenylobacterium sp. TaxID=1871053 RepID=UPI0025F46973|nr:class I SAM-dependent methyltransferase [Phenylobacterium sp.]MBI1198386.1 methyltransferase domain-containing protein [Phenylobacterium sp.]
MSEPAPNAGQIAYWNEQAGPTWAQLQEPLDRQLAPLGGRAIEALAPKPGERILDIGCGAGAASLELARAVAPGGSVLGVDISHPLLEVARHRAEAVEGATFLEADAQTYPFEPASFDGAFSRFGVMFFADPPAAFANIRRALKPGGRLAFVCWREPRLNPAMTLAMAAAQQIVEPPPPPEKGAPGPFAFADPDRVRAVLAGGGFEDVAVTPFEARIGPGNLDVTMGLLMRVGPLGALLREHPDKRDLVLETVRAAIAPHDGPDGVKLDSATWIVTARAPKA